jgi:hypothetical protein
MLEWEKIGGSKVMKSIWGMIKFLFGFKPRTVEAELPYTKSIRCGSSDIE